ncbi:Uncharacterized protein Rs2_21296 [Raphanus sativus]|nr:Uncharacterized protein Rs2_21296 [Raphanus sativus]
MMNRARKRKETSLTEELRELELLEEGEMVDIPDLEIDDLIEENSLSVIVRCLNPTFHKVGGLVKALPPIWGMEESVRGRGVGEQRVQFIFQSKRDLQYVLNKGPWFVNGWIVAISQWSPNPGPDYLCRIPFWIRIRGLPIHLLKKQAVDCLMGPLGKVEKVELHAKNSNSVEYVRALVWIKADEPLQFRRTARFKSGEVVPTELEYEKLIKVCFTCKRLTHDQNICPLMLEDGNKEAQSISRSNPISRARKPNGDRAEVVRKEDTNKAKTIRSKATRSLEEGGMQGGGAQKNATPHDRKGKRIATKSAQAAQRLILRRWQARRLTKVGQNEDASVEVMRGIPRNQEWEEDWVLLPHHRCSRD